MKKIIYILLITFTLSTFLFINKKNNLEDDSIRFRIIANSNDIEDQRIKNEIKKELQSEYFKKFNSSTSKEETEKIIVNNEEVINNIMKKYNVNYKINYGYNYFPEKEYNGIKYEEGDYKSLVIYIGEAKGNNWWCVMYPPLCLIDNSNNSENIEYTLLMNDLT